MPGELLTLEEFFIMEHLQQTDQNRWPCENWLHIFVWLSGDFKEKKKKGHNLRLHTKMIQKLNKK